MSPRHFGYGPWVQLQANLWLDPAVIRVGPWGELVYMRSLQMAKLAARDGHLSREQVEHISRKVYRFSATCERLVHETLWTPGPHAGDIQVTQWAKYNPTVAEEQAAKDLDAARKRAARDRSGVPTVIDVSTRTSGAKSRRERDIGSDRTPSGSVRSEPAPAAPRVAGGAAQPAEVVGSERTVGDWRQELAKGRAKNPASTGRNVPMSNKEWQPPERASFADSLQKLDEAAGTGDAE